MPDNVLPNPVPNAFDDLMRRIGRDLRAKDQPPRNREEWEQRRTLLRRQFQEAMGPTPDKPCALEQRILGTLKRNNYQIEKLVFQSQPDVWVTANLYLPAPIKERRPAVLVVHGHWSGARRDPVVQARCLGLMHLGFVVLSVDAFGAGERFSTPRGGSYHGALYGSTLWPSGHTLLGLQLYDNRRAVDYLLTRPEVDPRRLGVTGASGGGNQSMYAGALDERFQAAVPVCSVGTYHSYLSAACCVCEVLPGALRIAEEGDLLALTAPRALLVINATRDNFNFSVGEARRSIDRARPMFELYGAGEKLRHQPFESGHAYSQPMREAMYGWMTRWLKNEGKGEPIAEPRHEIEKPEDLACYPEGKRPERFMLLPEFAGRAGRALGERANRTRPQHQQEWEATAVAWRRQLKRQVFGDFPRSPEPEARLGKPSRAGDVETTPLTLTPEPDMPLPAWLQRRVGGQGRQPAAIVLHLDGKDRAVQHPVVAALLERGWQVLLPDLRATGETRPANDLIAGAPDHNSTEHALWVGRPLLGQWVFDVSHLLQWLGTQQGIDRQRLAVVGLGQAGLVALCAAGLLEESVHAAALVETPLSLVTSVAYPQGTRMGLLAPGILQVGDVPHLAALAAPRRLVVAAGTTAPGRPLDAKALPEALAFPQSIYRLYKEERRLTLLAEMNAKEIVAGLG